MFADTEILFLSFKIHYFFNSYHFFELYKKDYTTHE